ncbi:MAG: hypothetical protein RLO81_06135 [Fulvivirga sp.]|uniref:hypothetical protein n=1 Tax=Fulvivirga sp. TaxID=1931237 RepID=UPI0032EF81CF
MIRQIKELNIVSVLIRVSGMSGKFLMVIAMASKLSLTSVGLWGLISAFVLLTTFLLGLEMHTYYTPKISSQADDNRLLIQNIKGIVFIRIISFSLIYIIALPIIDNFISGYGLEILVIVILDSTSQEINRFLVAKGKIIQSNLVIALRSGLWCFFVLAFWYLFQMHDNFNLVLLLWAIFSFISVLIGLSFDLDIRKIEQLRIDKLLEIINYSRFYIASSASMRSAFFLDKLIISYFLGRELLGIYTMFQTVFNSILSFIEAGILSKYFNHSSKTYFQNGLDGLIKCSSHYKKIILSSASFLIICLFFLLICYFYFVNQISFLQNWLGLLIFMLSAIPFLVGQMVMINLNILDAGQENMKTKFYSAFSYLLFLLLASFKFVSFFVLAGGIMIFSILSWLISQYFFNSITNR